MKKASRRDPVSPPPFFERENEPAPFHWSPRLDWWGSSLNRAGAELARNLFDRDAPPLTEGEIQARVDNYYWRLAYPGERYRYAKALGRARTGDDEMLFKLVRLFGRRIEVQPWVAERWERAQREGDEDFHERYEAARRSPLPLSKKKRGHPRRFILAFFEPELREQTPKNILKALHWLIDAGVAPTEVLPRSLDALRHELRALGWHRKNR